MASDADACNLSGETAARLSAGALTALLLCGPVFMLFPHLDTQVSSLFYSPGHGFSGLAPPVEMVRNVFKLIYILACVFAVAGVVLAYRARGRIFGLRWREHLFVIICLVLGPGIVANVALKDQWGRARPREIVQFGGDKAFTAVLVPARQCRRNCSFISGEASSIFMAFFALALVLRRSRGLIGWGLACGFAAGLIRIAQGGHFMSDVIFAGIFMALTAAAVHALFVRFQPRLEPVADKSG